METWKDVLNRLKSPVVIVGLIVLILNTLRLELGWTIPVTSIETILNFVIYGGIGGFAALNNPTTREHF